MEKKNEKNTSPNTQYATTFCSVSLRKTPSIFARGKLPLVANCTTGKHRILRDVIRHILMTTFIPINLYPALNFYKL